MKRIILIISIALLSCKKEEVKLVQEDQKSPQQTQSISGDSTIAETDTTSQDTIEVIQVNLFESNLDDSLFISSNEIVNGYLYNENEFTVRIDNINPDSVRLGTYMNEYLVSNVNYGIDLIHTVIVGDGSKVQIALGSSATQINTLEITEIRNDSVWIVYDVDWTYTHWQFTDKNKSGNIKAELNGFKFR